MDTRRRHDEVAQRINQRQENRQRSIHDMIKRTKQINKSTNHRLLKDFSNMNIGER